MGKTKRMTSHYELLGVSRTATTQEIRAAYLRLMKRHHPDAAQESGGTASLVPDLNRCYAVLRNPAARSDYDSQLEGFTRAIPGPHHTPGRTAKPLWPAVALASALAIAFWLVFVDPALRPSAQATVPLSLPLPDATDTRRMAQLGRKLPIKQAEQFSRRCFAGTAQPVQSGQIDSCVLFDAAFLYWRQMPGSSALSAYFADPVVDNRHREAMTAFGPAGERRLFKLRQMAFLALVQSIEESRFNNTGQQLLDHRELRMPSRATERKRLGERVPEWDYPQGGNRSE